MPRPIDPYTVPPMPNIRPAVPALTKLVEASQRAAKSVSKEDLIDALTSVQYWANQAHEKAETGQRFIAESPRPRGGLVT